MKFRSLALPFSACAALSLATTAAFAGPPEGAPPPASGDVTPVPPSAAPPPPGAAPPPGYDMPPPKKKRDGVRVRGGVSLEGGAMIAPGVLSLGVAGIQGQTGVQINDMIGVYAVPSFDIVFGKLGGINVAAAIMVDFTFMDLLSVGVGPDIGAFAAFGGSKIGTAGETVSAAAGALYGARLHFAVHPALTHSDENPIRRKALSIGVDLRILGGGAAIGSVKASGSASAAVSPVAISPQLTLGYTAF